MDGMMCARPLLSRPPVPAVQHAAPAAGAPHTAQCILVRALGARARPTHLTGPHTYARFFFFFSLS